ncbi:Smr/MutS family protein [Namhaeicola litoreus]|uniref:Smr/MutS family protein n=1 Tax=Namhaeicola litoreus TaxID=1052145 RepID=A0ABW3Y327_9FLAO
MKNQFNIGDLVSVVDEDLSGKIIEIKEDQISFRCTDDFVYTYSINELVQKKNLPEQLLFQEEHKFRVDKVEVKKKTPVSRKMLKKTPSLEVDLHIEKIIETYRQLDNYQILEKQLDFAKYKIEFALRKNIKRIVFIHGVGTGVLKYELLRVLKNYPVEINEASYAQYGEGATEIFFIK